MHFLTLFSIIAFFGVSFAQQYSESFIEQAAFPKTLFPTETNLFRVKKSFASAPNYPLMLPAASNYVASTVYPSPIDRQLEEARYMQKYNEAAELVRMRKHAPITTVDVNTPYDYEASASTYSAPSYSAPAPALHPGPATSYSYASHAPTVPCAKNILVSCSPSVAPVPCSAPSYAPQAYAPQAYVPAAPICPYAAASLLGSPHHTSGDKEKREASYLI